MKRAKGIFRSAGAEEMASGQDIQYLSEPLAAKQIHLVQRGIILFGDFFVQLEANSPAERREGNERGGLRQVTAMLFGEDSARPAAENPGNTPMTCDNDIATTYYLANYHPTQ